jgi:transposase
MSRRKLEISHRHYSYRKLKDIYEHTDDAAMKLRILAILQTWDGLTSREVAENLHVTHRSVSEWINRYNENSLQGLEDTRGGHYAGYLSNEQKQLVKEVLQKSPMDCGFNRSNWTMPLLKLWIDRNLQVNYKAASLYDVVHNIGFTLQRPKKRNHKVNPQLQEQYKEELKNLIETSDNNTVILYEDEAIITDEPTTNLKWALKGNQPIIPTDNHGPRQRRAIFGAVNPADGHVYYSTYETGNSNNFKDFLK